MAKVAMAHGINANIVHGWRKLARTQAARPVVASAFVTMTIEPMAPVQRHIEVEVRCGAVRCR